MHCLKRTLKIEKIYNDGKIDLSLPWYEDLYTRFIGQQKVKSFLWKFFKLPSPTLTVWFFPLTLPKPKSNE